MLNEITNLSQYILLLAKYLKDVGSWNSRILPNIGPEDRLSLDCVHYLKTCTLEKNKKIVWFKVANEFAGNKLQRFGKKLKILGKHNGIADYVIASEHKTIFVELKVSPNKQSNDQKTFQAWCEMCNIDYYLVYSYQEFEEIINDNFLK